MGVEPRFLTKIVIVMPIWPILDYTGGSVTTFMITQNGLGGN